MKELMEVAEDDVRRPSTQGNASTLDESFAPGAQGCSDIRNLRRDPGDRLARLSRYGEHQH